MAFLQLQEMSWHSGEREMQSAMKVPFMDNPTVPAMSPQLANHLQIAPLIAIGTLDEHGRPWTTLWGGDKGLGRQVARGIVGIRTAITGSYDPVVEELFGKEANGEVRREDGKGRMVGGLTIDLETRKRVKMFGRMIAGARSVREDETTDQSQHVAEAQLVLKIEQSLGNCPKYLNMKHIEPAEARPTSISDSPQLPQPALELLKKADLFFLSSSRHDQDMDTNHRGGPPGFFRVVSNDSSGDVLCWPEYSGNRFYQTLGNLKVNPLVGICVPDFETGDMLYLTGETEILIGVDAAKILPRSNLAVKVTITASRFVSGALPFRGMPGDLSPYNPVVRYLASEANQTSVQDRELSQATLLSQTRLTPTISRYKFALENAANYKPGQYVTLDFSSHLNVGYSHMRDDDPRSLNDDFVRTFTVSSPPGSPPRPGRSLKDDEFEITIRRVGVATEFMSKFEGSERDGRNKLEVGVKGFGGEFEIKQDTPDEKIDFIAAGVGITPILPSLHTLDFDRLRLLWAVRGSDLPLVKDILDQHRALAGSLSVFLTHTTDDHKDLVDELARRGVTVRSRRIGKEDVDIGPASKIYLCTHPALRKQLMEWLPDKNLLFEDFNF